MLIEAGVPAERNAVVIGPIPTANNPGTSFVVATTLATNNCRWRCRGSPAGSLENRFLAPAVQSYNAQEYAAGHGPKVVLRPSASGGERATAAQFVRPGPPGRAAQARDRELAVGSRSASEVAGMRPVGGRSGLAEPVLHYGEHPSGQL